MRLFCAFFLFLTLISTLSAQKISSPTGLEIFAFLEKRDKGFLQPASSGRIESAMFGMVRNGGTRFHEGIDIRSDSRMGNGTPMDLIHAIYPGTVAHISRKNNGSYGRYVVLTHKKDGIEFYTLYSHLLVISSSLEEGQGVSSGEILGMLGQTSTVYKIPSSSAHLHFEVGLVLGGIGFDNWFIKHYGRGNLHGRYNGFNLVGADPLDFYEFHRNKKDCSPYAWINSQDVAFTLRCNLFCGIPDILVRSPSLMLGKAAEDQSVWEIDFTWFGMPVRFRPLKTSPSQELSIVCRNSSLCMLAEKRGVLKRSGEIYVPGKTLSNYLDIIFNGSINPRKK